MAVAQQQQLNVAGKLFSFSIWLGLLVWLVTIGTVVAQSASLSNSTDYSPTTNVYINCGDSGNATVPNIGLFLADSNSPYISEGILARNSVATNEDDDPYPMLLETARLFPGPGESIYKIPVAVPGRVWLRLWFYPITFVQSQQTYKPDGALFSVMANGYTLFVNLTAGEITASTNKYLYVEYMINVTLPTLSVTFIPQLNSFAFVNALAVVSIPDKLLNDNVNLVPPTPSQMKMAGNALETMYRLNVGGGVVTPSNDSSLTRQWDLDAPYLYGAVGGVPLDPVPPSSILYPQGVFTWVAPNSVYSTARTLGSAGVINALANLTWSFKVDPGYAYYVRLHFAETAYTSVNQRVFNIFLNNQTAQVNYDCVAAAGGKPNAASFRDFVVPMYDGTTDHLWLAMGPSPGSSQYADAILNGLEIFKLNNTKGSLAGAAIHTPITADGNDGKKGGTNTGTIVGAAVGGLAGLGVILAVIFFLRSRKSKTNAKQHSPAWLPLPLHGGNSESRTASKISTITSHKSGTGSYVSSAASSLGRYFTFSELQEATNNFDEDLLLGVGGFGKVYKAEIDDGMLVAVKRGNPRSEQGLNEFQTEIELLSKLRHRHLVSLIGYCEEHCEMILVYDYMANGPLRGHLYGTDLPFLTWKQRLEICVGAARGLHYLHTGAAQGIIHRDVKTTNILLDDNFVAKVADFGLSKTGPSLDRTHVSTAVKGSFGYLDPEYFRRQQLTEKSDVYSFGVVLMEVVCARPAINPALPREQVNIAEWALQWQKMGMLEQIIDPKLVGYINPESLRKFGETAEKCLAEQGIDRPAMGDVLWNLEYALQLQDNSMENRLMEGSTNRILELPLIDHEEEVPDLTMMNRSSCSEEEEPDDVTASAVFSQLVNPQGR